MMDEFTQRERIPVVIHANADVACAEVADAIEALIRERNAMGKATVLGMATGFCRKTRRSGHKTKVIFCLNYLQSAPWVSPTSSLSLVFSRKKQQITNGVLGET